MKTSKDRKNGSNILRMFPETFSNTFSEVGLFKNMYAKS